MLRDRGKTLFLFWHSLHPIPGHSDNLDRCARFGLQADFLPLSGQYSWLMKCNVARLSLHPYRRSLRPSLPPKSHLLARNRLSSTLQYLRHYTHPITAPAAEHTSSPLFAPKEPSYSSPRSAKDGEIDENVALLQARLLPTTCPGCGALSSNIDPSEPGFYSRTRKAVKFYLRATKRQENAQDLVQEPGANEVGPSQLEPVIPPVCDRCHDLLHNSRGTSIAHPSIGDIADSIAESPFSRNHVYHVLDAADFPMSLMPSILSRLSLAKPRSQNRRSKSNFSSKPTLSFIITRSDLLGPTKEKVDLLMPYFRETLRQALVRGNQTIRLGNVHLVSSKRGWWTREIKDSIWERGGGNWMVGKFNVGKSALFEVLFPKGSGERAPVHSELFKQQSRHDDDLLSETSLLPPAQPETPFPALPVVSSLPGTTASPIRLPFGNRKGELIDMPGLGRGNLEQYVQPEHQLDLVMTGRPKVRQHTIKPGQSLLLGGGLIRITPALDPNDPSTTMLAYPFVPIDTHVTSTEKAIAMQAQERESGVSSIMAEGAGATVASAGILSLETDVTRDHAGKLLRAGFSASRLPFKVYSTDLLIEGVGWVELVCQVRRRGRRYQTMMPPVAEATQDKPPGTLDTITNEHEADFKPFAPRIQDPGYACTPSELPRIEVFTPNGKHVAQRASLGAWTVWQEGNPKVRRAASGVRPRRSMKSARKAPTG